jgi:hypothetical protein
MVGVPSSRRDATMSDHSGTRTAGPRSTDDRLADTDVESLIDEDAELEPNDERVVPEDVNEHVPDDDGRDEV